jgi:hypothetical protein
MDSSMIQQSSSAFHAQVKVHFFRTANALLVQTTKLTKVIINVLIDAPPINCGMDKNANRKKLS